MLQKIIHWTLLSFVIIAIGLVFALVGGVFFKWGWNHGIIHAIPGLNTITYWQAFWCSFITWSFVSAGKTGR